MKPLRLSLALAALLAATPVLADPIPLSSLSAYLNSFQTAQADFTQINADGSISTGTLSIKRPGRARFEYAPPEKALVLAGGGQVAVYDDKSNQPPEQYPLKRTPLNLILERNVDLGRARMVVGHAEDGTSTRVVAQDPEHPDYGTITLVFTNDPVELRQWIITDEAGSQTTVVLGQLKTGMPLGARMFNIIQETADRMKRR
ncbi:LolA family protein [Rhodovulum sulfidophilum]|uniref:LolA family protein n=1 Tax=Rhodovulum sulfidophilum TaxID=35806 RepID=UPI0005A73F6E|nr:outer membrane lipoprotein carrier protein LolA [Rhodovulum sulfidophilum]ANB33610.1 cell envelope biogenesis protein LolA [Rhodovulum sulfidophilum DSM 1374]ANB37431.1 cell envelope biogenesis protein LolA [Rhodovulum sulfidophilum]MBK5922369.1 outer membrane lipoprotein carrier protein LolA [Rhodovulum sulfidophilum]MBL3551617.1 outer membrane lipoprotein carrier protein LolA [Rhodovulum sulfidophilum]MBL3561015.1 outer membrane lipoprotein carrier protein LolA [Rhodovulum sulfidophilum]